MTEEQKIECVIAGIIEEASSKRITRGSSPTDEEINVHLWGAIGRKTTEAEQVAFVEARLGNALNGKGKAAISVIRRIPAGSLITYGNLARWMNSEYGTSLGPRNLATFRKQMYGLLGHDTEIPIHRIVKEGDIHSKKDHEVTQEINRVKRTEEGFFKRPVWIEK